jgi:hypothetical protein
MEISRHANQSAGLVAMKNPALVTQPHMRYGYWHESRSARIRSLLAMDSISTKPHATFPSVPELDVIRAREEL